VRPGTRASHAIGRIAPAIGGGGAIAAIADGALTGGAAFARSAGGFGPRNAQGALAFVLRGRPP
jgi:hypothetical protein